MQSKTSRFMRSDELMALLGYATRGGFWQAVHKSNLSFIRISPRRVLFDREEIERWLESRRVRKGGAK
jgi:predicted DNA-binding transcriptional regulator AlpA